MKIKATSLIPLLALIGVTGCAPFKQSGIRWYRFDDEHVKKSTAPVVASREVPTMVYFTSVPHGATVHAYDNSTGQKSTYIGKTPCRFNTMTYNITEFADMTAEYSVDYPIPHEFTRPVDFSDIKNDYGEVTFSFLFEKKGYPSKVFHLPVKATAETLVMALAERQVPAYQVFVELEE
jgi:hypothetical protein